MDADFAWLSVSFDSQYSGGFVSQEFNNIYTSKPAAESMLWIFGFSLGLSKRHYIKLLIAFGSLKLFWGPHWRDVSFNLSMLQLSGKVRFRLETTWFVPFFFVFIHLLLFTIAISTNSAYFIVFVWYNCKQVSLTINKSHQRRL